MLFKVPADVENRFVWIEPIGKYADGHTGKVLFDFSGQPGKRFLFTVLFLIIAPRLVFDNIPSNSITRPRKFNTSCCNTFTVFTRNSYSVLRMVMYSPSGSMSTAKFSFLQLFLSNFEPTPKSRKFNDFHLFDP